MFDNIGKWIGENKNYLWILVVASVMLLVGAYLKAPEVIKGYIQNLNFSPLAGSILFYLGQLIIITLILKFFLGMKPFKEAIYNIFKEIFLKKEVIEQYNNQEIYKIIQNISKLNDHIMFQDLSEKYESVNMLRDNWREEVNSTNKHIYVESHFTTTIYENGQVILNRRIECEMMEDGEFVMKHYFIPFDEDLNVDNYSNDTALDRWNKKSFKKMTDGLENQDRQIGVKISNAHEKEKDWILFEFNCSRIPKGKKFTIEFSISDKIPEDSFNDKERLEDYFKSVYAKPHAVRHIKFQVETYKGSKVFPYIPFVRIGKDKIHTESRRNIYYTSWSWDIYYSKYQNETIQLGIDKNLEEG